MMSAPGLNFTCFVRCWIRVLWLGCVLANWGISTSPTASILFHTLTASLGSKQASAINCKPISSASVSHFLENGFIIKKFKEKRLNTNAGSMPMNASVNCRASKSLAKLSFSALCLANWCEISWPKTAAMPSNNTLSTICVQSWPFSH